MTGKVLVLPHARRKRARPDSARRAMEHRAMRGISTGVMPALHAARKSAAFADAGHIHKLAHRKTIHQNAVTSLRLILRFFQPEFAQEPHRRDTRLLEMPGHGLVHTLW